MSIAITEDHRALADTVGDFLTKHDARAAARALLEAADETNASFFADAAALGWLGLHVPEEHGGSGYGLEELVVVVEQLGRAVAPGAFVPTVVASAVLVAAGARRRSPPSCSPVSPTARRAAAVALGGDVELRDGALHGSAGAVIGAGLADVLLVAVGDDVAVVDVSAGGVTVESPPNLDPTRRAGRVSFDGAAADVLPGARQALVDMARTIFSAEAIGVARECTESAAAYAKERQQFGRPIAMFQAVKHHCANMLVATELATAAVWDAARAASAGGDQFSLTAAMAAALAMPAADLCANLNIQVHGGIGFTWEHDAHLYLRRAAALGAIVDAEEAAVAVTDLTRAGVRRARSVDLPPEAEPVRDTVARVRRRASPGSTRDEQRAQLIESGYVMPHWPAPWGRDAGAVEQLVIEQEFERAGVQRPAYGITGWVILTLIQHATEDQVARWVRPALNQDVIWCQLFSEPDAGSDAAGIKTRGTRVDGGWLVNGQKVWTSGRPRRQAWLRHGAHQPRRAEAQRDHDDGHRHGGRGCRGAPAEDDDGQLGVQRGVLQRRARPRRRRRRADRRRLDGRPGDAGQRERQHRRRPGRRGVPGDALIPLLDAHPERLPGRGRTDRSLHRRPPGDGRAQPAQRPPRRRRWRARAGGQHHQAGAVGDRPRGGRHHAPSWSAPTAPSWTARGRWPG